MRGFDSAEIVLKTLEEHHPTPLTMKRLLHFAGLTPGQYRSAYNWTLDNFDEPIWLKVYIAGEPNYVLPEMARDAREDWSRTIRTQVTRARREHNKIHMIAKRHPTVDFRESALEAEYRLKKLQLEKDRLST